MRAQANIDPPGFGVHTEFITMLVRVMRIPVTVLMIKLSEPTKHFKCRTDTQHTLRTGPPPFTQDHHCCVDITPYKLHRS